MGDATGGRAATLHHGAADNQPERGIYHPAAGVREEAVRGDLLGAERGADVLLARAEGPEVHAEEGPEVRGDDGNG